MSSLVKVLSQWKVYGRYPQLGAEQARRFESLCLGDMRTGGGSSTFAYTLARGITSSRALSAWPTASSFAPHHSSANEDF